jgi:hypothetical protein
MAKTKRRRPPKPSFGKSDRYKAWPDDFVFLHEPALPIADDEVREIAETLGVRINSKYVTEVLAVIRRFHGRKIAMAELPSGDHRIRDIETLAALARAMDGLNANVLAALARYGVDLGDFEPAQAAEAAREAATEMAQKAPSRSGRRPKNSRAETLRELEAIYRMATGNPGKIGKTSATKQTDGGKPSGPFFRFIRAAVSPVPTLKTIPDGTLASAVTRATTSK